MGETCSVCGVPLAGSDVLYAPDGRIVCPRHFADIDPSAGVGGPKWRMPAIAGGIVGALPFAVHVSSSSMTSFNGEVTSFVYRDWIAVICGVIAGTLGLITLLAARRAELRRAVGLAAGVGVIALGGLQIARGFGVFESPNGHADSSTSVSFSMENTHAPEPEAAPAPPPKPAPAAKPVVDCADAAACLQLATTRVQARDFVGALAANQAACEKGAGAGCYEAAHYHAQMSRELEAVPLYARGCDLGDLPSCSELALDLWKGRGVDKDVAKAKELLDKACTGGHPFSCVRLGIMYSSGEDGVKKNPKQALAMFVKGCDLGDDAASGTGCNRAGEMLHDAEGVKADKKRAAGYLTKACERDAEYCYDLGLITAKGDGVKKDAKKAKALFAKACEAHNEDACKKK